MIPNAQICNLRLKYPSHHKTNTGQAPIPTQPAFPETPPSGQSQFILGRDCAPPSICFMLCLAGTPTRLTENQTPLKTPWVCTFQRERERRDLRAITQRFSRYLCKRTERLNVLVTIMRVWLTSLMKFSTFMLNGDVWCVWVSCFWSDITAVFCCPESRNEK